MQEAAAHIPMMETGTTDAQPLEIKSHIRSDYPLTVKGLKIDPIIFTQGFVECCDVSICSAECCWYGVYADIKERDLVMSLKKEVASVMDDSQDADWTKWFEPEHDDADFPSGKTAGMEVFNNKCVFLDKRGYCSLQVLAIKHGKERWAYKPYYCVLFPLSVVDRVLTFDDHHAGRMHYCGLKENFTHTIFEACTDELKFALGEDGYAELADHYEAHKEQYEKQITFR